MAQVIAQASALREMSPPRATPLVGARVAAGFPSPADDFLEEGLDLHKLLVRRPAATFFVRVTGESMRQAGILPGDILVVDRSVEPADGRIVIAVVDGELTVKRLRRRSGRVTLEPENPEFPPLEITESMESAVWGVVTACIHRYGG
ncbi:LexA family protein [Magnetofaba australis]|nr:translesion error-prone DNA polymerase V autoproteolytic subunit [Magnetofaba australis]